MFLTLFVATSYLMEHYFHRAKERELLNNTTKLAASLARFPDIVDNIRALDVIETFEDFTGTTVWIIDQDNDVLKTASESEQWMIEAVDALSEIPPQQEENLVSHRLPHPTTGQPLLAIALPLDDRYVLSPTLYVFAPLIGVRTTIRGVRSLLSSAGVIALLAATVVVSFTTRRITAPVFSMNRVVRLMAQGDLRGRVDVRTNDEIGRLGEAFNKMAAQLEHTVRQLSQEKTKTDAVVQSISDAVLFVDKSERIGLTNRSAEPILLISPTEAGGQNLQDVVEPDVSRMFRQVLKTNEAYHDTYSSYGTEYTVHISPVDAGDDGDTWGAVGLFHDTSEQARLERLRREFVADVSHELRTPLTSIRGFLEAIADGVAEDPKEAAEYLRIAITETERLQRLAETLLDMSSMEAGGTAFQPEPLSVQAVIHDALEMVSQQAQEKSIQIETDVSPTMPRVWADYDKVNQIIRNLLDNALHHTHRQGTIRLSSQIVDTFVRITVQDSGPGIPREEQPLVWERFYKVDKARSRAKGSGLGLVIVRQLVEMHGGSVDLYSELQQGAAFSFTLPMYREDVEQS